MTFAAVEDFLCSLPSSEAIQIPTRARHQAAGAEAAFVQALGTWANQTPGATLKTYAPSANDIQIERLCRRLYGMSACAVADRITTKIGEDITMIAAKRAADRIILLGRESTTSSSRGPQVEILCADHLSLSHPKLLYNVDENDVATVKDLDAFNEIVSRTIIGQIIETSYRKGLPDQFEKILAVALYELFRNTDEHGWANDTGDAPRKSIRGFQARKFSLLPETLVSLTEASPPMHAYCSNLAPARSTNSQVQLVEISVFDSGPGMAASLSGKRTTDLSFNEESELVRRCFEKHVSRKNSSSDGLGLPNLAAALTRAGGFMRVRTGRCAFYSNFVTDPQDTYGSQPVLRNWFEDTREAAPVAGTLFTLLFPLYA